MNITTSTKKAVAIAVTAATIAIVGIFKWYQPTGVRAVYDNKPATFMTSKAAIDKHVKWLKFQGFNTWMSYGMGSYMRSNPTLVQYLNIQLRRNGFYDIGFIYGDEVDVLNTLYNYNKTCTNDSAKFSYCISEIEQYQSGGDRPKFYSTIHHVSDWCLKNSVKRGCYQGWGNQQDYDTIVKYTDRMFDHAYGRYDLQGNLTTDLGRWVYSYLKSRNDQIVKSMDKLYPNNPTLQYSSVTIYSCENPDSLNSAGKVNTQFGFKYFKTNSWETPQTQFMAYWNTYATANQKRRILNSGSALFVADQAQRIKL